MQQCPAAGVTNYLKVGGLKQQIFILIQFWKSKDRNQGVSRATLPPKVLEKDLFQAPLPASASSLAYGSITSILTEL